MIIFINFLVVEILTLKGIPGFTPFFSGSHFPVEFNLAIELLQKLRYENKKEVITMNKEKKLKLKKITVASFVHLLTDEEKKRINGGSKTDAGVTWLKIFC